MPLWRRIISTEPAMVRGAIVAILALAGAYGFGVTETQSGATVAFAMAVLALLQAWSTRQSVTPIDKVDALHADADEAIQLAYEAGAADAQLSGGSVHPAGLA